MISEAYQLNGGSQMLSRAEPSPAPSPTPTPSPAWQLTQQMWLNTQDDINTFFLIAMGTIVFMLQLAFPLLESGMCFFPLSAFSHSPWGNI